MDIKRQLITDEKGNPIAPITFASCVYDNDGESMESIHSSKDTEFSIDGTKKSALILKEMLGKTIQNGIPSINSPIPLIHAKNNFINNGNIVDGNIELHGLDSVVDKLYLSHGKFFIERKTKEVDMGSLSWAVYQNGIYRVDLDDAYPYNNASLAQKGSLCSMFALINSTVTQMQEGNYKWASTSNPKRYYFKDTSKTDVESFKNSVVGQKFCYVLETPYIEEVPVNEVLNLLNLECYDGATTLSQSSDAKGQIEISVAKNSIGAIMLDSYSTSIEILASFVHIVS